MKIKERELAKKLRSQGMSFREIRKSVHVSKGTLSAWLRDIPLSSEQILRLKKHTDIQHEKIGKALKDRRDLRWSCYASEAEKEWVTLKVNPTFIFGLALYVGEGSKTQSAPGVTNCDPRVLRAALRFFSVIGVKSEDIRVCVQIHGDVSEDIAEKYWCTELGLPASQLSKTMKVVSSSSKVLKRGFQPFGTCRVRFSSTRLMVKILTWVRLSLSTTMGDQLMGASFDISCLP